MNGLHVKVTDIEQVTPLVKHFTFKNIDGSKLPSFSGGSHVVVVMNINGRIHRNPYSLMGSPENNDSYHISVRLQERSRGGSEYMHTQVEVGSELQITYPVNLFPLEKKARKQLLIAGGIGITPFMSQIDELKSNGGYFELHYGYRSEEHGAFSALLKDKCMDSYFDYVASNGSQIDLHSLFSEQPLGTHVYVCGPTPMVNAVIETARKLGWPEHHIHSEQFTAPPIGEPFNLKLAASGIEVVVPSDMSMLEAIESAGVDAPYLCRGGACGRCELEVLSTDGSLTHYDHYLTDAEKASGKKIMPCVSRANCNFLEINI